MVFFTICSKNFFAQALTLHASLVRTHGPIRFYVVLCDSVSDCDVASFPFEVITIEQLGIPNWSWMQDNYNITELNTSLKPFAFQLLFDRHPEGEIVYLDPDIVVVSRFAEVEAGFAAGAECILTPHVTEPAEFAELHDQKFLQFGVYNLGFCALRDTPQVRRVVSWWARRLEHQCVIDLAAGLFVDQKWVDLFPAYLENTLVLRHCGYNVAYWNLAQRRVWRDGARWMVNDRELRFAHFSGAVIGSETVLSRHSGTFNRKNVGALAGLLQEYENQLAAHGHGHYSTLEYAFRWGGAHGRNEHTPESARVARARDGAGDERGLHYLPLVRATSKEAYDAARDALALPIAARTRLERELLPSGEEPFRIPAHCALCGAEEEFQVGFMFASRRAPDGRLLPNWREHLDCKRCGLVNRVRASLHVLLQELRPGRKADVYVTETVTRTFRWLQERFPRAVGSEYLGPEHRGGAVVQGLRHEDVQALSFEDASFDFVLSFDVLEHVPDHERAFAEFFRCLRPGGRLLFTAPFRPDMECHDVRAVLEPGGRIVHLTEPEYHGNPVDPEGGALTFRYFGWQTLQELRTAGFQGATALNYWSRDLAYLGDPQFIFVAEKPA